MLSTIYLLKYNNYYNRILKKHQSVDQYREFQIGDPIVNVNFIPLDGISTKQIINNWNGPIPDYLIVSVDNVEVDSRWFVLEAVRNLKGQYELTLFRDTLADYLMEIMDAPMFVEKGPLADSDPFIFNNEDMTFNQVKKYEAELYDRSRTPWIVGFMSADNITNEDSGTVEPFKFKFKRSTKVDYEFETLQNYIDMKGFKSGDRFRILNDYAYRIHVNIMKLYQRGKDGIFAFNENGPQPVNYIDGTNIGYVETKEDSMSSVGYSFPGINSSEEVLNSLTSSITRFDNKSLISNYFGFEGKDAYDAASIENGKIIYITSEAAYYRISFTQKISTNEEAFFTANSNIVSNLESILPSPLVLDDTTNNTTFAASLKYWDGIFSIDKINGSPTTETEIEIPVGRRKLMDAPYCMFAIPTSEMTVFYDQRPGATKQTRTGCGMNTVLEFVSSMSEGLSGAGQLLDIQLLPYCPIQTSIGGTDRYIMLDNLVENVDYQMFDLDGDFSPALGVFWCQNSTFSFDIDFQIVNPWDEYELDLESLVLIRKNPWPTKLWNELSTYRLTSPNFASSFEFSPAKNGGVSKFNVDCTYKPFNSYIHINPAFSGLYGNNFKDPRGLICSGDFSLTQLNDQWQTYQWQNINFEKSFQRQIETMERRKEIQETQDIIKAITGTVGGTSTGALSGFMSSGHWAGAVAGGVIGGGASLAGGIADVKFNKELRQMELDLTQDQFNYNKGNIQALPTTLSKVSAFTANNKIVPILERYDATPQEKEALLNKLGMNGLTVMRIGTMSEFITYKIDGGKYTPEGRNYFKGKLIRIDVNDDFHVVNTISEELNKGVFI